MKGIFDAARARAPHAPLVTESNAETVVDAASGLLTIFAFQSAHLVQDGALFMAPAFPAVYGGFYQGFGGMVSRADFAPNADVLAARLAAQFSYGSQLGWFSLGGVADGPDFDAKLCGPMGTSDLWASAAHDAEIDYLRRLADSRAAMAPYFVHGRLARPPGVASTSFVWRPLNNKTVPPSDRGPFPALISTVWVTPTTGPIATACLFLVSTTSTPQPARGALRVADYFPADVADVSISEVDAAGTRVRVGQSQDGRFALDRTVPGRAVVMLELAPL